MGLISKLKSALGVGDGDRGRPGDRGTSVAVEREPDAGSERAVKGVAPAPASASASRDEPDETDAAEADSTPDTGRAALSDGDPVDSIKGIGAAYAERLADAGVETVTDLAEADAEELSAETGLGAGRVGKWIERAKARSR